MVLPLYWPEVNTCVLDLAFLCSQIIFNIHTTAQKIMLLEEENVYTSITQVSIITHVLVPHRSNYCNNIGSQRTRRQK